MLVNMLPALQRLSRRDVSLKDSSEKQNVIRGSVDFSMKAAREMAESGIAGAEMETAAKNLVRDRLKGPVVEFRNLTYFAQGSVIGGGSNKILDNISGKFRPGELHAILGPASSGRSSLLWALAGEISPLNSTITGSLLVDGVEWNYKKKGWERCGLVETNNSFHRDLSVRMILTYATQLRRDRRTTPDIVEQIVQNVMILTHISECSEISAKNLDPADLRLLAIAEELVNGKTILFVDEPTTNLNSAQTSKVMKVLEILVSLEYTVICTFHEPTSELFKSLDNIMLLMQGKVIYHGKANNAIEHFVSEPYKFSIERC